MLAGEIMPEHTPSRRQPIRGALLLLPMLAAALAWFGWLGGVDAGTAGNLSFGAVDATAEFVSAPPMNQMMMPMHSGADHGDQIQVAVQLRNDTDRPVTVPFGRIRMVTADGAEVAAVAGLVGDLTIRPHAAVEERLRFPAPDADKAHHTNEVRMRIPDGDGSRALTVSLHRPGADPSSGADASSGSGTHVHNGGHG
jgi:hypothetical protein